MKRNLQTDRKEMLKYEAHFLNLGFRLIAGVDEAGCGPLAGPVVAAAVILPIGFYNPHIFDSKLLEGEIRLKLFEEILNSAIDVGIGLSTNEEIDKFNIRNASILAMNRAILDLDITPDVILADGHYFSILNNYLPIQDIKIQNIIKGDKKSLSIASASIIAKVVRDKIMRKYHNRFPQYNFAKNKGYPTKEHLLALEKFGPCEIHRKSYRPVKKFIKNENTAG